MQRWAKWKDSRHWMINNEKFNTPNEEMLRRIQFIENHKFDLWKGKRQLNLWNYYAGGIRTLVL